MKGNRKAEQCVIDHCGYFKSIDEILTGKENINNQTTEHTWMFLKSSNLWKCLPNRQLFLCHFKHDFLVCKTAGNSESWLSGSHL